MADVDIDTGEGVKVGLTDTEWSELAISGDQGLAVGLAELAAGFATMQVGDTLPIALVEASILLIPMASDDAPAVAVSEASVLSALLVQTEAMPIQVGEAFPPILVTLGGQDFLAIVTAEGITLHVATSAAEALRLAVLEAEVLGAVAFLTAADTVAVVLVEDAQGAAQVFAAEGIPVDLAEFAEALVTGLRLQDVDSPGIGLEELAEAIVAGLQLVNQVDAIPLRVAEIQALIATVGPQIGRVGVGTLVPLAPVTSVGAVGQVRTLTQV